MDNLPELVYHMKIFRIKCLLREWVEKTHDLRYKMHSLKRIVLMQTKKVGRCISNLYCPYDECPFKLSAGGKKNTSNFQNVEGHKICFSCWHLANRWWCRAWKITEYCKESEILTIYHICVHSCLSKPNTKKYRHQVREAFLRNSGLGACAIQQAGVG